MSSVSIPDDVLMEILAVLPAKCLSRCKCVCKSWIQLIENRDFIAKHHQTQVARNNNGCVLIKRGTADSRYGIFSLLYSKGSATSCEDLAVPFTMETDSMGCVRLIGPCNGLFCSTNDQSSDITIWNPATREFKLLPSSPVPDIPPDYSQCAKIGLGFDSITNDYKVVRIWNAASLGSGHDHISKVEVWNLSDNSWRQINAVPPVLIPRHSPNHVYKNGKLYWQGVTNRPDMIVCFDMSTELFKGIEFPEFVNVGDGFWQEMLALNGSVSLISHPYNLDERRYEIWTMNEFGECVSWSKYMTVEIPIGVWGWPYAFWNNDEILTGYEDGPLVSYDPRTKRIKDLGEVYVCFDQQVVIYNESLVSIK